MIVLGFAVGIAMLIGYRVLARPPKRRVVSAPSAGRSGPASGNDAGDGGSYVAWSTGENSASDHADAASHCSGGGEPAGSDSGDASGGSDGGGGDGGGGDGGGGSD